MNSYTGLERLAVGLAKRKIIAAAAFVALYAIYVGWFAIQLNSMGAFSIAIDVLVPAGQFCGGWILGIVARALLMQVARSNLATDIRALFMFVPYLFFLAIIVGGIISIIAGASSASPSDLRRVVDGSFPTVLSSAGIFVLGNDATISFLANRKSPDLNE